VEFGSRSPADQGDQTRLAELEGVIERGLSAFIEESPCWRSSSSVFIATSGTERSTTTS
jgi:hypothetical protein